MTKLRIADALSLPLEAGTETTGILGIRGSGKTNTAAVMAEELLRAGQQVVIIDPTDAWWGLKSSDDGTKPGYPVVVLGGKRGDLPLSSGDGKLIADFVVEQGVSVICSLRGFESKNQELAFATAFLRRLYHLKGQQDAPTPVTLFIDEASRLVPQRVMGEDASCVGAVQQIVRQGRSSGFGVVLIDQRAATVNKDVLAMLEMMVVHRTTSPQDRKALREWIVAHDTENHEKEFLDSLASLKQGEAWFWSPGWLDLFEKVQVRARKTFDSSRTPRAGEVIVTPKKIAEVDLAALKTQLAATIEKAKADDPKALRAEITALKKQISSAEPDPQAIERAISVAVSQERVRHGEFIRKLSVVIQRLEGSISDVNRNMQEVETSASAIRYGLAQYEADSRGDVQLGHDKKGTGANHPASPTVPQQSRSTTRRAVTNSQRVVRDDIKKGQQKILNALAELEILGVSAPSRYQLGMVAGYNLTGGTGAQHIADLSKLGLVAVGDKVVSLTDEGRAAAIADDAPTTLRELHDRVLRKLPDGQRRIAEHLISIHPDGISRADLGAAVNYNLTGGTGAQHVADLVTVGAAMIPTKGEVKASDLLFPAGLR
jgi:hypothetical protein